MFLAIEPKKTIFSSSLKLYLNTKHHIVELGISSEMRDNHANKHLNIIQKTVLQYIINY